MGINTDSIIDISSGGINYGKIGISKTLNSLDLDELFNSVYCSASCQTLCAPKQSYNAPSAFFEDVTAPLTFVSQEYGRWNYGNQEICYNLASGTDNSDDPLYARIIWLYSESTFNVNINSDNASGYSLVTQLNAQQWDINVSDLSYYNSWGNRPKPSAFTDTGIEFMPYFRLFIYEESDTAHTGSSLQYGRIEPYLIYKFNDKICITSLWLFDSWHTQGLKYVQGDTTNYAQSDLFQCYDKSTRFAFETSMAVSSPIKTWGLDSYYDFFGTDYTEDYIMYFYKVNSTEQHYFSIAPQNLDALNTWLSRCGFFFKTDKRYKPVISGGYVTGYTDDLTAESDFDNYTGDMQHDVPDTPGPGPGPSGGGDDYEDMSLGVSNVTLGGLTKYAILTKQELIDLVIDYNTNGSAAGTNFSNHVICLYRLGFGASDLVVTGADKIKMIQSAGNVDFESSANYSIVTRQTPFIHFGSIKVPRHTGTFYDFSPYSSYELYIPGCGWIPLPDNVAGRTLNVYLVFDLPTCSAKGIVRIEGGVYGGTTIATVNGIIGASVPFTIGENGMQRAAIMSANAQVAAGIATGIIGATINPMMAVAGGAELLSGLIGAYTAGNTNYVSTKGGAADFSMFGDGAAAMLKYNAPEIDPVVNNTDFGHTVGYMCNETGQLSNFHGFTVCSNPHVHISATSTEKEEIKRLLEEGVILP